MAAARLEIAQRGLAVTVTRNYYALVAAQRKYATAQLAAQQAARFLEITPAGRNNSARSRGAMSSRRISSTKQQQQGFREATLAMDNARLALAVLLFPTSTRTSRSSTICRPRPALPPFADIRTMAERENPDLRAGRRDAASGGAGRRGPRRTRSCPAWSLTRCTASRRTSSRCTAASPRSRSSVCSPILATSSRSICPCRSGTGVGCGASFIRAKRASARRRRR